ncbi:MAG: hypothetical protein VX800_02685 [Chloroflexota bacterium]|nr:hypothetical protein [Chloroflexota bacterium]
MNVNRSYIELGNQCSKGLSRTHHYVPAINVDKDVFRTPIILGLNGVFSWMPDSS